MSASFVYDADGNRVQGTVNGTTTIYIAGLYLYAAEGVMPGGFSPELVQEAFHKK